MPEDKLPSPTTAAAVENVKLLFWENELHAIDSENVGRQSISFCKSLVTSLQSYNRLYV
jgi:hypothetical protein